MKSIISVVKNRRFDYKLLSEFIVKKQISLSEDYSKIKLTRDTLITGSCSNCFLETSKNFRAIIKQDNLLCKLCTLKNAQNKTKATFMKNYGVEWSLQSPEVRKRSKDTCMKKYGVENPSQYPEIKKKKIDTCMGNYGVEHPGQSSEIRQKMKDTCIEKYGVENPGQSPEVKDKMKDTCMKKYGFEYAVQSPEVRQKGKDTCIENYGVENPFQSPEVKDKMKDTCMKKYGVPHPMQNAEIAEKVMLSTFKYKNYILPSGKIIHYQGYENFAIEHFIKSGVSEENILNDRISVPEVWYEYEGKRKRYYVDIFIPDQNLCVEVKSTYTLAAKKDQVLIKHEAVKALGYLCEIWVYDKEGNRIEIIS